MKHEFGKRYPTSDAPESDEYPVVEYCQYNNPKLCSYAMDFDASGRSGTWQRLEQFHMAVPVIFKPKWADTTELRGAFTTTQWITAEGPMCQYASGPVCISERAAIEEWNKMWEQE